MGVAKVNSLLRNIRCYYKCNHLMNSVVLVCTLCFSFSLVIVFK